MRLLLDGGSDSQEKGDSGAEGAAGGFPKVADGDLEVTGMACAECGSEKQRSFPADIKIYADANRTVAPVPPLMSHVTMCLDCGFSSFLVPQGWNQLEAFRRAGGE